MKSMKPFSPVIKTELKEQLQINLLQVFEDVPVTDEVLDHMCDVIIKTVNEA